MKNVHPLIVASTSRTISPSSPSEPSDPVIRLKLDKPLHWDWELTTSADTLPVVQLLDKDGRLLVETTGRTAQRARGSFRDGLKSYQKFPVAEEASKVKSEQLSLGNRNIDGFSSKFGYVPTKSRSEANVSFSEDKKDKRIKKRHSSGVETTLRRSKEENGKERKIVKRYSAGDYLRQQIMDDLRSNRTVGRSPEQIANDRCNKVKAHLRSQSDLSSSAGFREEKLKELKEYLQTSSKEGDSPKGDSKRKEELDRIKEYLRERIKEKMAEEKLLTSRSQPSIGGSVPESKENVVRKRYSEQFQVDRKKYRTRKVSSEANIEFDPKVYDREKIKSNKRNSVARGDSQQRPYRRSRSDVIAKVPELAEGQKTKIMRNSTGSDRRKVYRKTKSDLLLGQMETSVESEKDYYGDQPRRIKSQDNVERSWREYKERKKLERLHKESDNVVPEEDFMSKPRWKDLQGLSCATKNCRVCENTKNCTDPFEKSVENETRNCERIIETNSPAESNLTDCTDNDRPGTTLQENYLVLEPTSRNSATRTPVISKIQVNAGRDGSDVTSKLDSPDFGYNSIQKNTFEEYKELYANSNVKKSDTFKIVDGSEDVDGILEKISQDPSDKLIYVDAVFNDCKRSDDNKPLTPQTNEDITRDYFKRVYELLKQRQDDARKMAEGCVPPGYEDTSSSNCPEQAQKKRRRRRRKDNALQGNEVVAVGPGGRGACRTIEHFLTNDDPVNQQRLRRYQQQQEVAGTKRLRHSPVVPASSSCKANARDIGKYFGSPNKENSPEYGVNENVGIDTNEEKMGSNLSRHNGKGLTGRRTQSSGNLCDPKGKLNNVSKILVPCSSTQRDRYKFCGSLPNHLDGKDVLEDDPGENNNVLPDTIAGNLGGTLPHKKRSLGVHFSDSGPTGTLDLVKHRSQDSLDDNPWRYHQSSDLDLVRCKHGNFDLVRRNQNTQDAVDGDVGKKYARGVPLDERCHRSTDLDLVPGALPKRRQDPRNDGQNLDANVRQKYSIDNVDEDLLMKLVHKPDCELMKHRQLNRGVDLKLSKLTGGEPQDQGYASERSPEDEHPPSLPGQPFPSVTTESTFRVTLQKSSRGLGLSVSGGGTAGPVRVKRLFPQQPAALSNKLQPGDILLAANGIPLTGLTNYEALEVLRTTPSTVELVVCRPPGDASITPPGAPPPPPARREPPPPLRILNPLPPLQIEPCGEFDIEMTKVGGSLGFTLRKADSSALGHYVRALVREPALSDGRIQPGDKIVAVDGAALSPMSHEEAVALLRQCGPRVRLRLYRDLAQTPVSALSPTEPDHPLRPPRTSLRQEAVDMLCDLAVRKLSPGTSSGSSCRQSSGLSCGSPRRLRRPHGRTPTSENEQGNPQKYYVTQTSTTSQVDTSDSDQCSIKTQITNSQPNTPITDIIDPPALYDVCDSSDSKPSRPSFLDLTAPQGKPHFQFSLDSDSDYTGPIIVTESDSNLATECDYDEVTRNVPTTMSSDEQDIDLPAEPSSMPPILSSDDNVGTGFSYKNPAYQSANPSCTAGESSIKSKATHSSDQDIPGKVLDADDPGGSKSLLKWKGVMFTPNDSTEEIDKLKSFSNKNRAAVHALTTARKQESQVFMVELTRGWNSRLGFSLQPEGNRTVISAVHADSVAAKDGRLKQGDVLMIINDESVEHMPTAEIIDLLRKIRGSIGITVMRKIKHDSTT